MNPHQNKPCSKRQPIFRPCVDSLRIPFTPTCILRSLSKPGISIVPPCFRSSCTMIYPICTCDLHHSTTEACITSTSSTRGFDQDGLNNDYFQTWGEEGGCKSIDDNELDKPCSREASCGNEQDECTSNNDDVSNRSAVCPNSYIPSITNPNATPNVRRQNQRDQMPNVLNKDCMQAAQYRPTSGVTGRSGSKLDNLPRSMSNMHNMGRNVNVQSNAGRSLRSTDNLTNTEACCGVNLNSNAVRVSRIPQANEYCQDFKKGPSPDENSRQNSDESDGSLNEPNPCCQRRHYQTQSENDNYSQTRQEFNDRQGNIKLSQTNMNYNNNNGPISDPGRRYNDSKNNMPSGGMTPNRNMASADRVLMRSPKQSSLFTDDFQAPLNIKQADKMCQKCASKRTSFDEMSITGPRTHVDEDTAGEYQERLNINKGLTPTRGPPQSRELNDQENENPNDDIYFAPNPCCVRGAVERTGSNLARLDRRSGVVKPTLRNKQPQENIDDDMLEIDGPCNTDTNDCTSCCEAFDSRPINQVNISQDNSKSKFSSDYKIGSQTQLKGQVNRSQTRFSAQNVREKHGPVDNFMLPKGPKKTTSCCSHGISRLIETTQRPLKINPGIDCVCPDIDTATRKKSLTCKHEAGSMSCTSTTCVVNNTSGCRCRYPPAYKQHSCTGNISGTCNCDDNN